MSRPKSHREQVPLQRCDNCRFSAFVRYKRDLLCFHGDDVEIESGENGDSVTLPGEISVELMDGEEYSPIWGGRVVDGTDICDEWKPIEPTDPKR